MKTISLKLPDSLLARLGEEARVRRVTKSELVRESIEKALAGTRVAGDPSCYELGRDLAGSLKGLPADLATNPDHLEGFGR
jgi:hypothetical protein